SPLADRDRGQRRPPGDVAYGIDGGVGGAGELVDGDMTVRRQLHAGRLQPQPVDVGVPAGGEHHHAEGCLDAIAEADDDVLAVAAQGGDVGLIDDADPPLLQARLQAVPQVHVEAAQQALPSIDDGGVDAEAGEDGGKFHRHVATPLDQDRV